MTKKCTSCMQDLPYDRFNKDSSRKDGLRSRCKGCRTKHERKKPKDDGPDLPDLKRREDAHRAALLTLVHRHRAEFDGLLSENLKKVAAASAGRRLP